MILIPEIETVVILVPRTGSGSLRRAIAARYPKAMQVYRHMEADGVPQGYDHWPKIGVIREPVERLWSLYKFLQNLDGQHDPAYIASMRASVARPFDDWLIGNEVVFTSPYDSAGRGRFFPQFTVRHPLPENRKSQFMYLRPDLGTDVVPYMRLAQLAARLDVTLASVNTTSKDAPPPLSDGAREHINRLFAWDMRWLRNHEIDHANAA